MYEGSGLRARKKRDAMHRIQDTALDLFEERGYDAVTIEEVANAAAFAPRTLYRYFGTKEMLVIWDEHDESAMEPIRRQLVSLDPIDAIRQVLHASFEAMTERELAQLERRLKLIYANPAIEAALTLHADALARHLVGVISSSPDDDLEAHVQVNALVGGILGAMRHWSLSAASTPVMVSIDRALAVLERGVGRSSAHLRANTGNPPASTSAGKGKDQVR